MLYERVRELGRVHQIEAFGLNRENFRRKTVFGVQQFLSNRGIQYSNKRKEELIELCVNAQDLHMAQLESDEACEVAIENKPRTSEGDLPKPGNLTQ